MKTRISTCILVFFALATGIVLGAFLGPRPRMDADDLRRKTPRKDYSVDNSARRPRTERAELVHPVAPKPESIPSVTSSGLVPAEQLDMLQPTAATPSEVVAVRPQVLQMSPSPILPINDRVQEQEEEQLWRARADAVRDRLVTTYENCLAYAKTPYKYMIGNGRTIQIIDESAFAESKAALLTAQSSFRFLQEEARRAGVPPGWVRIDWSGYRRNPNPEDAPCERVLPDEVSLP